MLIKHVCCYIKCPFSYLEIGVFLILTSLYMYMHLLYNFSSLNPQPHTQRFSVVLLFGKVEMSKKVKGL